VEVIPNGKELARALLVGGRLVQVELKLLLDAAALWSAQEIEDAVQPGVFLHDAAEVAVRVEEELVC
jgi:hypothetical protein